MIKKFQLRGVFILSSILLIIMSFILISFGNTNKNVPVIESQLLYDGQAQLGEGAIWNHETQTFWWIDIEGRNFHIYDPETGKNTTYPVQQRIGTVVPDAGGNAIVALQDGIYRLFLKDGSLELLAKADYDPQKFRFNDGKCDPAGRLWVGSMALDGSRETAALYRFDTDYTITKVFEGVTTSNGIVWSGDKTKMFYIDTPTREVKEYKYDILTGDIVFLRVAVRIPDGLGFPDGMSIDEHDRLWIGHWAGHGVYCWDPETGELLTKVDVAAKNVTACDFGGLNLDRLFITSASLGMSSQEREQLPKSGGLFTAVPGVKGAKSYFFGK